MGRFAVLVVGILLGLALCVQTAAALTGYADPCATLTPSSGVSYQGFSSASQTLNSLYNWRDIPDASALVGNTTDRQATAAYRIRGAEQVEIAFYSASGSFATLDTQGTPRLGGLGERLPLLYDAEKDQIYCSAQGNWRLLAQEGQAVFEPVAQLPGGLVPYGLDVTVSYDGQSFHSLRGSRLREREQEQIFYGILSRYYEVFRFTLPPGVQEVRVSLREFRALSQPQGGALPNRGNAFALASVSFTGGDIQMGDPVPLPPTGENSSSPSTGWAGGGTTHPDLNSRPSPHSSASSKIPSSSKESSRPAPAPAKPSSVPSSSQGGKTTVTIQGSSPNYSAAPLPTASSQTAQSPAAAGGPSPLFWVTGGAGIAGAVLLGLWLLLKGR